MGMMQMMLGTRTQALSASLSTGNIYGYAPSGMITTLQVVCGAVGGTGAYTYSWTRVSGSGLIFADSPSSAATTFSYNAPGNQIAVFKCTVSDGVTSVDAVPHVEVTMERT